MNEVHDFLQVLSKVAVPVAILFLVLIYLWREYTRTRRFLEELQRDLIRMQFERVLLALESLEQEVRRLQQEVREARARRAE